VVVRGTIRAAFVVWGDDRMVSGVKHDDSPGVDLGAGLPGGHDHAGIAGPPLDSGRDIRR
jgi:hypothetical protein